MAAILGGILGVVLIVNVLLIAAIALLALQRYQGDDEADAGTVKKAFQELQLDDSEDDDDDEGALKTPKPVSSVDDDMELQSKPLTSTALVTPETPKDDVPAAAANNKQEQP